MTEAPECCQSKGWDYPDGQKRCHRHATPDDRELVAQLDKRAAKIGIKPDDWPYGANIDVVARQNLLEWAEHYELRPSRTTCGGVCWLRSGRCQRSDCHSGKPDWMDHLTWWTRRGKPALLLAQPYGLEASQLRPLLDDDSLHVLVHARGWYGWGTVAIEIWRKDVHDEMIQGVLPSTNQRDSA